MDTSRFRRGLVSLVIGLWAAALLGAGSWTTGSVVRAEERFGVNLLRNPGFEAGMAAPEHWEALDADLAVRDARAPYAGDVSGLLRAETEEKEMAWLQSGAPLLAGGRYVLSGRVRADAPAVAVVGIEWDGEGGRQAQRLHRGLVADGAWQRVELEFVATADGPATARFGGIVHGSLWWDDVALRRIDDRPQQLAAHWEALTARHGHVYTGLIVDARGLGLRRGMSPKIVDAQGRIVYAGQGADRSVVIGRGLVSYLSDPNEAVEHSRLAVNEHYPYTAPFVVTATGLVDDPFGASVVISVADAARIRRELDKYDFLGRYAVVFLLGERP